MLAGGCYCRSPGGLSLSPPPLLRAGGVRNKYLSTSKAKYKVLIFQILMTYGEDLYYVLRTPGGVPNGGYIFAQESTAVVPGQLCSLPSRMLCWYVRYRGENRKLATS